MYNSKFTKEEMIGIAIDYLTLSVRQIYQKNRAIWEPRGIDEGDVRYFITTAKKYYQRKLNDANKIGNFELGEKYNDFIEKNFPDKRCKRNPVMSDALDSLFIGQTAQSIYGDVLPVEEEVKIPDQIIS